MELPFAFSRQLQSQRYFGPMTNSLVSIVYATLRHTLKKQLPLTGVASLLVCRGIRCRLRVITSRLLPTARLYLRDSPLLVFLRVMLAARVNRRKLGLSRRPALLDPAI